MNACGLSVGDITYDLDCIVFATVPNPNLISELDITYDLGITYDLETELKPELDP